MAVELPQAGEATSRVDVAPFEESTETVVVEETPTATATVEETQAAPPAEEDTPVAPTTTTGKGVSADLTAATEVEVRDVGVLVKYAQKTYLLSDEEYLRRRIETCQGSIFSSDREKAEELLRRLEILRGLKAAGQLDKRGLLTSPPRQEVSLLERHRQRIKRIQEEKPEERERSHRRRRRRHERKREEEPASLGAASSTVKREARAGGGSSSCECSILRSWSCCGGGGGSDYQ